MRMFGRWLLVILVSVAIKQAVFIVLIPAWQVPDEPAHVAYVQGLVEQRRLPIFSNEGMDVSSEMLASMTAVEDANPNRLGRLYPSGFLSTATTDDRRLVDGTAPVRNLAARNSPLYYAYVSPAYFVSYQQPIVARLMAMRVSATLLLLITVWLAVRLAKKLQLADGTALMIGAIVGWHPAMSTIFAGVNPDGALILVATWVFSLLLTPVTGSMKKRVWLIALAVGLATSIKPEGWFLAIPALAWLVWNYRRAIDAGGWKLILTSGAVMAILAGGWLGIQAARSPTDVVVAQPHRASGLAWNVILNNDLFERPAITFRTFWGYLGWSGVSAYSTEWMFSVVLLITILAGIGSIFWFVRKKEKKLGVTIGIMIIAAVALEGFYQFLYWQSARLAGLTNFPVHGRYYLPLIVPLALWLVLGLQQIFPVKFRWLGAVLVITGTLLTTVMVAALAWQTYRFERLAGF